MVYKTLEELTNRWKLLELKCCHLNEWTLEVFYCCKEYICAWFVTNCWLIVEIVCNLLFVNLMTRLWWKIMFPLNDCSLEALKHVEYDLEQWFLNVSALAQQTISCTDLYDHDYCWNTQMQLMSHLTTCLVKYWSVFISLYVMAKYSFGITSIFVTLQVSSLGVHTPTLGTTRGPTFMVFYSWFFLLKECNVLNILVCIMTVFVISSSPQKLVFKI